VNDLVRASGGLVFRPGPGGVEVLVVHRPRYDDWSLPKGKDDPGESPEEAAAREVEEETGYRCRVVAPVGQVTYQTSLGQTKHVRFFAMRSLGFSGFEPNPEVDDVRWVDAASAHEVLSYEFDRALVTDADFDALARTGTTFLVRHAAAGDRSAWNGDDRVRPLSRKGMRQALALAQSLVPRGIEKVLSSPHVRCVQTVEPLAAATGLPIAEHEALVEGADVRDGVALLEAISGTNSVLSSHGDVIPNLLDHLVRHGMELLGPFEAKKGSTWVVDVEAGTHVRARYLPPPDV
jgi:8-oxo-(d)GTP phosphatase